MQNKAHLSTARLRLRLAETQGAIDVIRNRLAHLTGLPAATIETESESMPPLPEVKQEDDLAGTAVQASPGVQAAESRAAAESLRARGEHRANLPSVDFAAQYGSAGHLQQLSDQFFQPGSFQRHNATIGVVIKFPLFSATQRARAEAADATRTKGEEGRGNRQEPGLGRNSADCSARWNRWLQPGRWPISSTRIAQSNLESLQVRLDAGSIALARRSGRTRAAQRALQFFTGRDFRAGTGAHHAAAGHRRAGSLGKRR